MMYRTVFALRTMDTDIFIPGATYYFNAALLLDFGKFPLKVICDFFYDYYSHCLNILLFVICENYLFFQQNTLKLRDFGSCMSICSQEAHRECTSPCWYWAPKCLLTNGHYSYRIGIWSPGCVFCEITRYSVQSRVLCIINQDNQR